MVNPKNIRRTRHRAKPRHLKGRANFIPVVHIASLTVHSCTEPQNGACRKAGFHLLTHRSSHRSL
jgi:hypothetical protein